ncbi:MAG TPA: neutral zinc metallopeptidase [Candidatus Angelobacter sp.]|nr:neutral zinc metallopeptidase [Candidatus Angelobacter sp.]
MRWTPGGRSPNLEDRRGSGGFRMGGLGSSGFGIGGGRLGLGGLLVLFVLSIVFRQDFFSLLGGHGDVMRTSTGSDAAIDAREEPKVQFVSFVLDDAQNTWRQILPTAGIPYRDAKLVLFRDAVNSGCGFAQSATGPFYCPADQKIYIDLGFYDELANRFGASGDFAQAYVLAHEIGHHVQNLLGIESKVRQMQRTNPGAAKALSVRMELQADCFAGVWGHSTNQRNILEPGDVEKAMNAAAAIGDDRLQRMSTGRVSPESFTHGSSQQRMQWFNKGQTEGKLSSCNTFAP